MDILVSTPLVDFWLVYLVDTLVSHLVCVLLSGVLFALALTYLVALVMDRGLPWAVVQLVAALDSCPMDEPAVVVRVLERYGDHPA